MTLSPVRPFFIFRATCLLLAALALGCSADESDKGDPLDVDANVPPTATPELQPMGCIGEVGPADHLSFSDCGADIEFHVSVPQQCAEEQCGLIFDVHGLSMSGPVQEKNTEIAAIGRQEGYIVVQPSSPDADWEGAVDDEPVAAFLKLAIEAWDVDRRRVHFTGFSQGGAMTLRMRCELADIIASAAPTSMSGAPCADDVREMPTLYIQGQDDVFISAERITLLVDGFIDRNDLTVDEVLAEEAKYIWTRYSNDDGLVFEYLNHQYTSAGFGGHCIVGSPDVAGFYGCEEATALRHGQIIVDFFKAHPMPMPTE